MYIKIFPTFFLIILFLFGLTACSENDKSNDGQSKSKQAYYKNLNITILIDLSDRISIKKNPTQVDRDIKFIMNVLDAFKTFLSRKGVVQSEDKIKVIYYPSINYEIYQDIADSLNIDFSNYEFMQRKKLFENISSIYYKNLKKLYSLASNAKSFEGSDLFNYFKHRVVDDCISNDSNFINLLIVLTDGYIYHKNSKYQDGNRFSYLLPEAPQVTYFRNINNWETVFDKNDFGLIKLHNDLSQLNILCAEFSPIDHSPKDFDILKKYWTKWLIEQNINKDNLKILRTDLNTLNRDVIFAFFNKILSRDL
ncbi:hypothetical protein VJY32_07605 [Ignavibacteria bacterium 4148-Me]